MGWSRRRYGGEGLGVVFWWIELDGVISVFLWVRVSRLDLDSRVRVGGRGGN